MRRFRRLATVLLSVIGGAALLGVLAFGLAGRSPGLRFPTVAPSLNLESKAAPADSPSDGQRSAVSGSVGSAPAGPIGPAGAPQMRAVAPAPAAPPQPSTQVAPVDFGQRLIVRTGSLVLLVDDVADASSRVRDLAESAGGFVVSSVQREENGKPAASVTVRVPADRFDSVLDKLKGLAVRVSNEQVSSRDITEEFVDTDARLRNLKATEARYLDLLQQARTVEDVLKVEQQLSNIRGQIEQLQGRLQFLQRSSESSTITLELRPFVLSQPTSPADWSLLPVFRGAWAAFLGTVQLLVSALVWVAIFAPIWLPLGFLLWRRRRRHALPAVVAAAQSTPAA